jgi:hypothetical protein
MSLKVNEDNFGAYCAKFSNERACFQTLFDIKWPDGYRCPQCGDPRFYLISTRRLPLYECRACRVQTSLISGTIMEGSRTPLHRWFQAIYLHTRLGCVNARQLAAAIQVTYKTAWLICHKIRRAMTHAESGRFLSGIVRVSDTLYSKRLTPTFEWHNQEQLLLVGASGDSSEEPDLIVVEHQSKANLRDKYDCPDPAPFIHKHVAPKFIKDTVFTRRYGKNMNQALAWMGYHITWWAGRIFRGIGPKHLQVYLNQFCYYYNRPTHTLYDELLSDCVASQRITYKELIRSTVSRRLTRTSRRASRSPSQTG